MLAAAACLKHKGKQYVIRPCIQEREQVKEVRAYIAPRQGATDHAPRPVVRGHADRTAPAGMRPGARRLMRRTAPAIASEHQDRTVPC